MIGAIIGDIVGSRFEFNNTEDYHFEFFHPDCDFTDDTILTIAMADAINQHGTTATAKNFLPFVLKWCNQYPHPKGAYGSAFARWIRSNDHTPYQSFGNGAAMRLSPIVEAAENLPQARRLAIESARLSHDHTESLIAVEALATACFRLKHTNEATDSICNSVLGDYYHTLPTFRKGVFDVTCQYCVPLAFEIFKQSHNFEDAIRKAVSFGGDSDTLAAIVGTMAETRFAIPSEMVETTMSFLPQEMKDVISGFNNKHQAK